MKIKTAVYGSKEHRKKIRESLKLTRNTGQTAAERKAKAAKGAARSHKRSQGLDVTAPLIDSPFIKK